MLGRLGTRERELITFKGDGVRTEVAFLVYGRPGPPVRIWFEFIADCIADSTLRVDQSTP